MKAQIHEKMENRIVAAENYKKALEQDIFCYEAFSALVSHHMISSQEGIKFDIKLLSQIIYSINLSQTICLIS